MVQVLTFEELDSTNAEARRRAEAGERGPVWLMARRQTAGVGRRGRAWDSGERNLTATLLLTLADKTPMETAQLAFVAGLAAWTTIAAYVPPALVKIKWPNDVLIEGRKACGMLIESGPAEAGTWAAVGVGVNLATYPTEVERPATAIAAHLPSGAAQPPSPEEALTVLAKAFDEAARLWLSRGFEPIRQAWQAHAAGMGGPCTVRLERETVFGTAEGLDADGALLLRLQQGDLRRITAGDVFFGAP
jgi:BirA family biotin operon repressor/biotin-[acetyl-CoA-carboxylase] ligase